MAARLRNRGLVMDRRSWGIVLLAVVIVCAVVIPVCGGRREAGIAQPVPPQPRPGVGDCLDLVPSSRSALDYMPPLRAGRAGACDDQNLGEIVFVADNVSSFPRTTENTLSRPEVLACEPLVRRYLGWPDSGRAELDPPGTDVPWRPWSVVSSGLIGPNLQQYFAGQRWVACVAYPQVAPFSGSLAGSVRTGRAANAFATCLSEPGDAVQPVGPCTRAHQTELFGWVRTSQSQDGLQDACRSLVERLTAMPDPTAGGLLTVRVAVLTQAGAMAPGDSTTGSADDRRSCMVSADGDRRLTGTLVGLGNQPLPLR